MPGDFVLPWVNPRTAPGPVVGSILQQPDRFKGKIVPVAKEWLSPDQMMEQINEVNGAHVKYVQMHQSAVTT